MAFVQLYSSGLYRSHGSLLNPSRGLTVFPSLPFRSPALKRARYVPRLQVAMGLVDKDKEFQNEEEKRLQNDKRYVFREFSKVSAAAIGIGLVLFFYDILISLVAVGIGFVYAIAVLLDIPGTSTLFTRAAGGAISVWVKVSKSIRTGYRVIRREVRKGLED